MSSFILIFRSVHKLLIHFELRYLNSFEHFTKFFPIVSPMFFSSISTETCCMTNIDKKKQRIIFIVQLISIIYDKVKFNEAIQLV